MRRTTALILLLIILAAAGFVHAQDDTITATVAVESANVRWMPETLFYKFTDLDSKIGELHAGDQLILHRWESVGITQQTWVYATHGDLTGWIRSDLLNFESDNWQEVLPQIDNWTDLSAFVAENAPNGLQSWVSGSGGYSRLNVRAEPYYGGAQIGQISTGSIVTILGRALSNDLPLPFVYVRDNATGLEGWVIDSGLGTFGVLTEGQNPGLPTLYEVHPLEDTAGLPQFQVTGNFNLRQGPGLDAPIRRYISGTEHYAATGRTVDAEWVKITDLSSGEVGWIFVTVLPEGALDVQSLPVVE